MLLCLMLNRLSEVEYPQAFINFPSAFPTGGHGSNWLRGSVQISLFPVTDSVLLLMHPQMFPSQLWDKVGILNHRLVLCLTRTHNMQQHSSSAGSGNMELVGKMKDEGKWNSSWMAGIRLIVLDGQDPQNGSLQIIKKMDRMFEWTHDLIRRWS